MHRIQNLFILVRARDGQNAWMMFADIIRFSAQTSCNDDFAVFLKRFANCVQAFGLGAVEKSAGIDDHRIRASIIGRDPVPFGAQASQDAFAVDQRFWAS